jgi:hypothetical protein
VKPDALFLRASSADSAETLCPPSTVPTVPDSPIHDHGTVSQTSQQIYKIKYECHYVVPKAKDVFNNLWMICVKQNAVKQLVLPLESKKSGEVNLRYA